MSGNTLGRIGSRADKIITEADTRTLRESYQVRSKRAGRGLYVGALATAKLADLTGLDGLLSKAIFESKYRRLSGGCQQIVFESDCYPGSVLKVDRRSLEDDDSHIPEHLDRLSEGLAFTSYNFDDDLANQSTIVLTRSPIRRDQRSCLAVVQPKVEDLTDMVKVSPSEWATIQDGAPHLNQQLSSFVDTTDYLLRSDDNPHLPDLFGPSNLVSGSLNGQTNIYLIDALPLNKSMLDPTNPDYFHLANLDSYKSRLDRLGELACAY